MQIWQIDPANLTDYFDDRYHVLVCCCAPFRILKVVKMDYGQFPFRRHTSQNIVHKLAQRQIVIDSPGRFYYRQRSFFQCIVPNYTESDVTIPPGYLRKFFPDGRRLLGFSSDQKSVMIYNFLGTSVCQELYEGGFDKDYIKLNLFNKFFKLKHTITIPELSESLNRECSLFTDDCNYVIVGSSGPVQDNPYPHWYDMYRNSEGVFPNLRHHLEDISILMIDTRNGFVCDEKTFKCDKIHLAHNQGVSLCGPMFAVLSVQHQTIYLFQVSEGSFIPMHDIGRFCYPDDELIYSEAQFVLTGAARDEANISLYQPFHEKWFNSLKHRLLCCLLRQAELQCTPSSRLPLVRFFEKFNDLSSLRLWKMQLLSDHELLLKYASEDTVTMKHSNPISQPALIALYDIKSTEMVAVFENTSQELLQIYESHADSFRVPVSHPLLADISSVSNNTHARALHMKFKQTITNAKYGGTSEATRRLLMQLPICSQCHSSSPYLDLVLFSYDEKLVSAAERPKQCGDSPVRFITRQGGLLSFTLETSVSSAQFELPITRRLVAFLFHPFEPLVISIQKMSTTDYAVCLHFRQSPPTWRTSQPVNSK